MAIENDDDRLIFFSADDFGETVEFSVNGDSVSVDVIGIFDEPNLTKSIKQDNQFRNNGDASGQRPFFRGRTSDLTGVRTRKSTILARGTLYTVENPKHDGTGLTTVDLIQL